MNVTEDFCRAGRGGSGGSERRGGRGGRVDCVEWGNVHVPKRAKVEEMRIRGRS